MTLAEDLLRPEAYEPVQRPPIVLRETHISLVFLGERDVFKIKKPVSLGFLDFRTIEQRKAACDAEVSLNSRLAPHVYLGLEPVRTGPDGRGRIGGDGPIVDWAVHMRRLPDDTRADELLARGALTPSAIASMARCIAAFHRAARCDAGTARFGTPAMIARNVEENFAQSRETIGLYLRTDQSDEVMRWQTSFLRDRAGIFDERIAMGRVRDGHGDLRLEHVYFEPGGAITVIDCVEFNERFRFADVCSDIAFLSMDLAVNGRVDLAELLLASYARESDDFDLYAVVDFYESYRAFVRAKIAAMLAGDPAVAEPTRQRAGEQARRLFLLALSAHRRPLLRPAVIAVGGIIASGKSTIADRIGAEMGAPVVDTDRARKGMVGVEATRPLHVPGWSGAYDPDFTKAVYAEVLRRAGVVLDSGRAVVLDASFRSAEQRRAARELAFKHQVPFRLVECRAPADICRARLVARSQTRGVSDGRLEIFDDFCSRVEPVTELSASEHIVLDTTMPVEQNIAVLRSQLDTWPASFVT